jgi:hypothetical protein
MWSRDITQPGCKYEAVLRLTCRPDARCWLYAGPVRDTLPPAQGAATAFSTAPSPAFMYTSRSDCSDGTIARAIGVHDQVATVGIMRSFSHRAASGISVHNQLGAAQRVEKVPCASGAVPCSREPRARGAVLRCRLVLGAPRKSLAHH